MPPYDLVFQESLLILNLPENIQYHCTAPLIPDHVGTATSNIQSPRRLSPKTDLLPCLLHALSSTSTLITIAGQLGLSISGQIPSSLADQVALALENLSKCLEAAGATTRDIVKVTQYIVDYDPSERSRAELYLKFIGDHRPPSTLVGVTKLAAPDLLYEIEAMAVVHEAAK